MVAKWRHFGETLNYFALKNTLSRYSRLLRLKQLRYATIKQQNNTENNTQPNHIQQNKTKQTKPNQKPKSLKQTDNQAKEQKPNLVN